MTHIVVKEINGRYYLYEYKSVRVGKTVKKKFVRYIGPCSGTVAAQIQNPPHSKFLLVKSDTARHATEGTSITTPEFAIQVAEELNPKERTYLEAEIRTALENIRRLRAWQTEKANGGVVVGVGVQGEREEKGREGKKEGV